MIGPTKLCPRGIRLVFFDLDDTVMVNGALVTPRLPDALDLVREHGCVVCVSTGRAFDMLPGSLCQPRYVDYLLCANGSQVYDVCGDLLYDCPMTREQTIAAMDALGSIESAWYAFMGDRGYFEYRSLSYMNPLRLKLSASSGGAKSSHTGVKYYVRRLKNAALRGLRRLRGSYRDMRDKSKVRNVRTMVRRASGGIAKLGCTFASSGACNQALVVLQRLDCFEVSRMGPAELEITARGVTKGTGARWLMDYLGIEPSCAVAFGDSWNDASLADACGAFVAAANADKQIRIIADDICESVHNDGVARWLERAMAEGDAGGCW